MAARKFPTTFVECVKFAQTSNEVDLLARLAWQSDSRVILRLITENPACPETLRTVANNKAKYYETMTVKLVENVDQISVAKPLVADESVAYPEKAKAA